MSLLLVFGAAGVWWLIGSRAFQNFLTGRLHAMTGVEWTVGRTRIQWPCDLVAYELEMRSDQAGASGAIHVGKARWGWRPSGRNEWEFTRATVTLVRGEGEDWKPAFLAPLGRLTDPAELDPWLRRWGPLGTCVITEAEISWKQRESQSTLAEVDGLEWATLPGGVDGRPLRYYALLARLVYRAGGIRGERIRREWVALPAHPYVEIMYEHNWREPSAKPDFWSLPQERMDARSQPIRIECPVPLLPDSPEAPHEVR